MSIPAGEAPWKEAGRGRLIRRRPRKKPGSGAPFLGAFWNWTAGDVIRFRAWHAFVSPAFYPAHTSHLVCRALYGRLWFWYAPDETCFRCISGSAHHHPVNWSLRTAPTSGRRVQNQRAPCSEARTAGPFPNPHPTFFLPFSPLFFFPTMAGPSLAPTTPTSPGLLPNTTKAQSTATGAYLILSGVLSCALLAASTWDNTDAPPGIGLLAYAPLLVLFHHLFVLVSRIPLVRARWAGTFTRTPDVEEQQDERVERAAPMVLGPLHRPVLRLLAGVYLLGALLSALLARDFADELAGTHCSCGLAAYCYTLGARLAGAALACVLAFAGVVVLMLLARGTARADEGVELDGEEGGDVEEEVQEKSRWSFFPWSRGEYSQVRLTMSTFPYAPCAHLVSLQVVFDENEAEAQPFAPQPTSWNGRLV